MSPVVPSEIKATIADPSGSLCGTFTKVMLKLPVLLYKLFAWMFDTEGNLSADFLRGINPPGSLLLSLSPTAPPGYLFCNGDLVLRSDYTSLFAVIGITYGAGNGSTTFQLPDYRDKFPVGAGGEYALAATGGEKTHVLTKVELPADKGSIDIVKTTGTAGTKMIPVTGATVATNQNGTSDETNATGYVPITDFKVDMGGTGTAHNNVPPYLACRIYIKT